MQLNSKPGILHHIKTKKTPHLVFSWQTDDQPTMRLLNADTLEFEEFFQSTRPKYAILSHTWEKEEVSFQQYEQPDATTKDKTGYLKIVNACKKALERGIGYIWVDTCCIDKRSSAELSEAINYMFRWYQEAEICFAYLADVDPTDHTKSSPSFHCSRWFTRGWTLQELLAPMNLDFFASDWSFIANRTDMATHVSVRTGIDEVYLTNPSQLPRHELLAKASIAERMSWASGRNTSREEDIAYCLLGIFGITMSLRYGEGKHAFVRLQEKILRESFDPTLLAWSANSDKSGSFLDRPESYSPWRSALKMLLMMEHPWCGPLQPIFTGDSLGLLAPGPECFARCKDVVAYKVRLVYTMRSDGLEITLPISQTATPYAVIPCRLRNDPENLLAVPLDFYCPEAHLRSPAPAILVNRHAWHMWPRKRILLRTRKTPSQGTLGPQTCQVCIQYPSETMTLMGFCSKDGWESRERMVRVNLATNTSLHPPLTAFLFRSLHAPLSAFLFRVKDSKAMIALIFKITQESGFTSSIIPWLEWRTIQYGFIEINSRHSLISFLRDDPRLSSMAKHLERRGSLLYIDSTQQDYLEGPGYKIAVVQESARADSFIPRSRFALFLRARTRFDPVLTRTKALVEPISRVLPVSKYLSRLYHLSSRIVVAAFLFELLLLISVYILDALERLLFWTLDYPEIMKRGKILKLCVEIMLKDRLGFAMLLNFFPHATVSIFMFQLVPLGAYLAPRFSDSLRRAQIGLAVVLGSILVLLFPRMNLLFYRLAVIVRYAIERDAVRRRAADVFFFLYTFSVVSFYYLKWTGFRVGTDHFIVLGDCSTSCVNETQSYGEGGIMFLMGSTPLLFFPLLQTLQFLGWISHLLQRLLGIITT